MSQWRVLVLATLIVAPIFVLAIFGTWALWQQGWWWWLWWLMPACWGIGYLVARCWRGHLAVPSSLQLEASLHWTPTDEEALKLVEAKQAAVKGLSPEQLSDPQFYLDTAMDLGREIARHYHPHAHDAFNALTVPEILAAAHLACEDLEKWVHGYVPGSHLLTVGQWRAIAKAPRWFRWASNVSWAVTAIANPWSIVRYAVSKLTVDSASRELQSNVLAWFHVAFVRLVGSYLIEVNSGRLRGGTDRYRQLHAQLADSPGKMASPKDPQDSRIADAESGPLPIEIAIVGQVKAGKSSLINAILGEQKALTDVLPVSGGVERFELALPATHDRLILLDTPGYGVSGAAADQLRATWKALERADLVLFVMNAANPARQADIDVIRTLAERFVDRKELRPPALLGVLTHIDLLSPVLEWSPPYDWQNSATAKARSIAAAVEYNREQLEGFLVGIVPVCTDVERGRSFGVRETLIPVIVTLLGEARAVSLLRALHLEQDTARIRKAAQQLCNLGRELFRTVRSNPQAWPGGQRSGEAR